MHVDIHEGFFGTVLQSLLSVLFELHTPHVHFVSVCGGFSTVSLSHIETVWHPLPSTPSVTVTGGQTWDS